MIWFLLQVDVYYKHTLLRENLTLSDVADLYDYDRVGTPILPLSQLTLPHWKKCLPKLNKSVEYLSHDLQRAMKVMYNTLKRCGPTVSSRLFPELYLGHIKYKYVLSCKIKYKT